MPKERKKVLCMDAQRHAEYYGMQQTFDELYAKSKAGEVFNGLMELVLSPDNIMLAYRNIQTKGAFLMAELKITAANFENEVLRSDKPVLLDFYADWCGPCKMLSPILHELAEEKSGTLKVGKVNVDEQMELAMRFQVSSIPMLVVFKDGKAVAKSVGYRPKSEIAAMVEGAR